MRVLVTGASGMIGSAVCDRLLAKGEEVVGLSRDPARARSTNPTVTWHAWDPASERPPAEALEGVDAAINLVGAEINQRLTDEAKEQIHDSRIGATKNLVEGIEAAKDGPKVLVSQSAVGYYGPGHDAILDESAPPGEGFLAQIPVAWEAAAREAERSGVRVAILRTGLVLEPDGGILGQLLLPFKLGVGGPLAGGAWYMPWIHRDDEVALLIWAAENESAAGTFNASAPNPVTNKEFSRTLGKVLGRPAFAPVPQLALTALRGSELAQAITESRRVVPRHALDLGFEFRWPQLEPALRDLLGR